MKTKKLIMLTCASAIMLAGASTQAKEMTITDSPAPWWTDEQCETLDSIKKLDEEGYLYEITYSADYKMDEIIEAGTWPVVDLALNIKETLLPDSEFSLPVNRNAEPSAGGCTTFATTNADGHVILSRNYDWTDSNSSVLLVKTPAIPGKRYASISTTDGGASGIGIDTPLTPEILENFLYAPFSGALDGINEKGLAVGLMILNMNPVKQETGKQILDTSVANRLFLDHCSTVDECIALLKEYDMASTQYDTGHNFHWLLSDATGRRVVLEYVNNELVVNETPLEVSFNEETGSSTVEWPGIDTGYLVSTNFYVTEGAQDPSVPGDNGYWRYQTIVNGLKTNPNPTNEEAMKILESARYYMNDKDLPFVLKQEGKDPTDPSSWKWKTLTSSIYDLDELTMDLCIRQEYDTVYHFALDK